MLFAVHLYSREGARGIMKPAKLKRKIHKAVNKGQNIHHLWGEEKKGTPVERAVKEHLLEWGSVLAFPPNSTNGEFNDGLVFIGHIDPDTKKPVRKALKRLGLKVGVRNKLDTTTAFPGTNGAVESFWAKPITVKRKK